MSKWPRGGSFPAEIWCLFMEPALENVEPTPFAEPAIWPEWQPFTRGRYALTYDPYYTPPAEEDETEGKEGSEEGEGPGGGDEDGGGEGDAGGTGTTPAARPKPAANP